MTKGSDGTGKQKILWTEHVDAASVIDEIIDAEGIGLLAAGLCDLPASYGMTGKTGDVRMMKVCGHYIIRQGGEKQREISRCLELLRREPAEE